VRIAIANLKNFGLIPEYVLRIVPKRKEKGLILEHIWVDAKTFRIRRIERVLAQSPSIWIKDSSITLQFGEVNEMWMTVSLDVIATVRLWGATRLRAAVGARSPASMTPRLKTAPVKNFASFTTHGVPPFMDGERR